ncbi:hypothetical protein EON65_38580 [archaeon]|nr:MAG: hypothetical protein EON65_38580 [archaeon]
MCIFLQGEMNLVNTELEPIDRLSPCQIFVTSFNGEHNLLMQTAIPEESNEWRASLKEHIRFANSSTVESVSRLSRRVTTTSEVGGDSSSVSGARKPVTISTPDKAEGGSDEKTTNEKDTVPEQSPEEAASSLFDTVVYFFTDSSKRSEYISQIQPRVQSIIAALLSNSQEGEVGSRGEQLLGTAAALIAIIFIGFIPRLVIILNLLMRISSTVLIASGLAMFWNAVWELGDKASPFVCPPLKLNAFVKTGVYGIVRHPMYGGIILLCFGWAMLQQHTYKVFFTIALSIVLVSVPVPVFPPPLKSHTLFTLHSYL